MNTNCTIQLFADRAWHDVATCDVPGELARGWEARTVTGYETGWVLGHQGQRGARALSATYPVGLETLALPHWPVFLQDLLPQGYGRRELLRRLELPETAEQSADWRLLLAGAGNPIGNLRLKQSAQYLAENEGPVRGFTDEEVVGRESDFIDHLANHGLFVAGSSGVQGEWPKLLLTRADDALLYLDHSLPDERAREHFIVKFERGTNKALSLILQCEATYMELAKRLTLNVRAPLIGRERALFVPRFDRRIEEGRVVRLAQESIASFTGVPGFGVVPAHETVCQLLLDFGTDPQADIVEYIKRDVANIALGNKDNHARNTAIQRGFDGSVRLTPLYDFAPMYLHPDGIARRMRWKHESLGQPDWGAVINALMELALTKERPTRRKRVAPSAPKLERSLLVEGLRDMVRPLREIAAHGVDLGLPESVWSWEALHCTKQADLLHELT
jgi:serine/threonine-protein kinase HipA